MDISETFRTEDLSKADLFDFVVHSSDNTAENALPQFGRSLKSFGIYLESPSTNNAIVDNSNSNNENDTSNNISDNNNNNSNNNEDCDKLINIDNRKERNNNLLITNGSLQYMDSSTSYWSTTTVATCKDDPAVRWEHSMLEDLNCWSQDNTTGSNSSTNKQLVCDPGGSLDNNTDGAIYTLTVLNGNDQNSTWYRLPETSTIQHENEDSTTNQNHHHHHATTISHGSTSVTPSIDFDSLINNIIPSSIHQQTNPSSFTSYCTISSQDISTRTNTESNSTPINNSNNLMNEPSSPIKTEYLYDDNFQDNKSNATPRNPFSNASTNETLTNNSSEWKSISDTTLGSSSDSRANSLLRSALQGKSNSFSSRYNGGHTHPTHTQTTHSVVTSKSDKSIDGSSTIPVSTCKDIGSATTATNSGTTVTYAEIDENIKTHSPLMAVSLEGGTVVMFDGGSGSGSMIVDSDNPSSAQSMDDIFLSHLDAVTFAEDYEKLKSIENEVAKSVEQYCTNPYLTSSTTHITMNDPTRIPSITHHLDHTILNAIPSTTSSSSSSSKSSKKYAKRSSNSNKTSNGPSHHQLHQTTGNSSGNSSVSAGGIRKERSLHYCTICHKGFKDKYSVNVHVRTHTGEKPFTCTFCGKNFRQKAHLAKHHHTHSVQKNAASNVAGNSTKPANNKHR